jgi:hypothetical protein
MDSHKSWHAMAGGKLYIWKPLPGLDPGLGERACWIAAAVYAKGLKSGESEVAAQQAAEREAFKVQYGLGYPMT